MRRSCARTLEVQQLDHMQHEQVTGNRCTPTSHLYTINIKNKQLLHLFHTITSSWKLFQTQVRMPTRRRRVYTHF